MNGWDLQEGKSILQVCMPSTSRYSPKPVTSLTKCRSVCSWRVRGGRVFVFLASCFCAERLLLCSPHCTPPGSFYLEFGWPHWACSAECRIECSFLPGRCLKMSALWPTHFMLNSREAFTIQLDPWLCGCLTQRWSIREIPEPFIWNHILSPSVWLLGLVFHRFQIQKVVRRKLYIESVAAATGRYPSKRRDFTYGGGLTWQHEAFQRKESGRARFSCKTWLRCSDICHALQFLEYFYMSWV